MALQYDLVESIIRAVRLRADLIAGEPYGQLLIKWDTERPLQVEVTVKSKEHLVETA